MEREPRKKNPNYEPFGSDFYYELLEKKNNMKAKIDARTDIGQPLKNTLNGIIDTSEPESLVKLDVAMDTCSLDDMKEVNDLFDRMGLVPDEPKTGGEGEGEGETTYTATDEELRQNAATALLGIQNMSTEVVNVETGDVIVEKITTLKRFFDLAETAKKQIKKAYNRCVGVFADSMIHASLASYLTGKLVLLTSEHSGDIFSFLSSAFELIKPYLTGTTTILATTALGTILKKIIGYYGENTKDTIGTGLNALIEINNDIEKMNNSDAVDKINKTFHNIKTKIEENINKYKPHDTNAFCNFVNNDLKKILNEPEPKHVGEIPSTVSTVGDLKTGSNDEEETHAKYKKPRLQAEEAKREAEEAEEAKRKAEEAKRKAEEAKRKAEERKRKAEELGDGVTKGGKRKSKKRRITKKKKHIKRKATKKKKYSKSKTKRKVHKKK